MYEKVYICIYYEKGKREDELKKENTREMSKELTPLERRFINELLKDGNRAAAAERAGCKGTKSTFKKLGHQMISKENVRRAYDKLEARTLEKAMISRDTLINEIQETIMEARDAKKFDAAFKGYGQLGEILGIIGNGKKKLKDDAPEPNSPKEAFNQGDDEVDLNDDLSKFLKMMDNKSITNKGDA